MKRLLLLLPALALAACAINPPPKPPEPPAPRFDRTVGAMFTGVQTPDVKLHVDNGQVIPCAFDRSQHTVCVLDDTTPAPYGNNLQLTAEGFAPIDFRFETPDFTREHPHLELPEQNFKKLVTARPGLTRAAGRVFVDDAGPWNPVGKTMMWGVWGWKFDQPRTRQNLACLAGMSGAPAGCPSERIADYVRVFASVQGGSWQDRETRADWPDYVDQLRAFIVGAYNDYGLRTEITVIAGGDSNPVGVCQKVAVAVQGIQHMVIHGEAANELNWPDDAGVAQCITILKAAGIQLVAPYSPTGGEFPAIKDIVSRTGASMGTAHPDRSLTSPNDEDWRQARKGWSEGTFLPYPTSINEPTGPQASVAENWSPLQLALMRVTGIISGTGAYVYHAGPGIRGGGAADINRGRNANYWEMPMFAEIGTAIYKVGNLMQGDTANWQAFNQGWAGNPLSADAFWTSGADHGVVRMYTSSNGPGIAGVLLGVKNFVVLTAQAAADYVLHDGKTGAVVERRHLNPGEQWRINGAPNADAGYLLIGSR